MSQRSKIVAAALALTGAAALAGCGQKGPLFLPGQNPNPPTPLLDEDSDTAPIEAKTSAEPGDAARNAPDDRAAEPTANEP